MTITPEVIIIKQVEIPEAFIALRSDGIVIVRYKENTTLDVELQVRMRQIYIELTGNEKLKFIFSADEGFVLTKEARENSEIIAQNSPIRAYAIIVNNLAYRLVANFYHKVNKPKVPFKLFASVEEAAMWLDTLDF